MYYRRKVLLALLERFGGTLGRIEFMKLLFILTREQEVPSFDFIPYHKGCFSLFANVELSTLKQYEKVSETETNWQLLDSSSWLNQLHATDRNLIEQLYQSYGEATASDLIGLTYRKYPWYATRSNIKEQYLTKVELEVVAELMEKDQTPCLFTIGYEGRSIDAWLNELLKSNVRLLCDVRHNPLSRKYGFSKKSLSAHCERVGIGYLHLPALGIESQQRQNLNSVDDRIHLFAAYGSRIQTQKEDLAQIENLIRLHKRVALMCFELCEQDCHRGTLAKELIKQAHNSYTLRHL